MTDSTQRSFTRRAFVQTTAAATAGLATTGFALPEKLAGRSRAEVIRIGLVGCGGRGRGAVADTMKANQDIEIVALGDLMPDRLQEARETFAELVAEDASFAAKYKVTDEMAFTGFDAYQKVLAADIDLVMFATPPGFRPMHLEAAVVAGKHIFTEKPVAVDAAGIRSVLATYDAAKQKGLAIVAGTQRRHAPSYREVIRRIHEGAIGDVVGGQVYWNQGGLWHRDPNPEWSPTEWQIRNWLYFTWLSGDHIVEQHVHNIDVANWVLNAHPVKAVAVGGRQWRTDPAYGHIYDHFAVDFEYPNGVHILSMARQIDETARFVGERFFGTNGRSDPSRSIEGQNAFQYPEADRGERVNEYEQEHADLIASIRAGEPINELQQVAESTLSAIMGREAAYTGQEITWNQVLEADQNLLPPEIAFGPLEVPPVAVPGLTKLERGWTEGWITEPPPRRGRRG